jgi:protoporphyrinogen oxidase
VTAHAAAGADAVLGGGALGLTVALRLAQQGRRVVVYEREALAGGLAAGFEIEPGIWLDKFYHHLFRTDTSARRLIAELGLDGELTWHRPTTATLHAGRQWQLDSARSLLRFGPLTPIDRLRMGLSLAFLRALPSPAPLEGTTAARWIRGVMGTAAYDTLWGPLLRGKFGIAADQIAMPWFWARIHDRTAALGYLAGGFQRMYEALARQIQDAGGEVRLTTTVEAVEPRPGGCIVRSTALDGSTSEEAFDRVVSTLPTRLTCRLVPSLPADYRARYEWGEAYGAHCLILALDRPLTDVYWLNITDPGYPFMAMVEHTNMRSPAEYGGRHLVYLGTYRPMSDPIFGSDPDALVASVAPFLARINPAFEASWITERWAFGAPFVQPIVTVDYRDHIPPFETPVDGLYVANMFQVYPHDRGQNYSVRLAERLVKALPPEGSSRTRPTDRPRRYS